MGRAAPEARRRLGGRLLHPHDDLGARQDGPAQPDAAVLARLHRGLRAQVGAHGRRDPGRARRGPHGHHRLPVGRGADAAAARAVRRGGQGGREIPGDLRQGQLLPGDHGPRPRHRAPRPRRADQDQPGAEHPAPGDQRLALHLRVRRRLPRRPPVHPDRQAAVRPRPVPLRRQRLLHQERRRDARGRLLRPVGRGLPQHAAGGREGRSGRILRLQEPHADLPDPRGHDGERVLPQDRLGGHGPPLAGRLRRGAPQAGRIRDRHHRADGLPELLPRGRRLHHVGQGERHPGRAGARLGGRVAGGVRDGHHRPRPAPARPDLRTVPQPRARVHARRRHRLRRTQARRRHPLRDREVGRRQGRHDRHVRHHQGEGRHQGRRPRPRLPLRARRPRLQGVPARRHGQGHPARRHLRQGPPALQRGRRAAPALRGRRRRQGDDGPRQGPGGPDQADRRARRRRDHVGRGADRPRPDHAPRLGRRDHHAVRLSDLRDARPAQDGLPGPAQPHHHGRLPQDDRGDHG